MLAAFNANFDRAETIRQQHGLSLDIQDDIMAKPMRPAVRHRRGLSLDQGIAKSRQRTLIPKFEPFEPLQWKAATSGLAQEVSASRPQTPIKHDETATTQYWRPAQLPRGCKTAQSSPVKQYVRPILAPAERARSSHGVMNARDTLAPLSNTNCPQPETLSLHIPKMSDDIFSDFTFPGTENFNSATVSSPVSPMMPCFPQLSGATALNYPISCRRGDKVPIAPATPPVSIPLRTATSSRSSSPAKTLLSPRALSIADLNLDSSIDASIEETGITLDDIATHIEGPDPIDNKWVCKYDGCNKRFGRKENIKSHVQTHLGDRQFKCNHCNKCFVRGHDLKRHSKIHTGVKPYPCECGNSFARHDALTRHKQRGMCSGAFAGAVRKPLRRGRPKKRPDAEERRDKAVKTHERSRRSHTRNLSESSCASFVSSASECASGRDFSPANDLSFLQDTTFGLPPDAFSFTPPASPSHSTGNIPSPSRNYHSIALDPDLNPLYLSPSKRPLDDIPEEIPDIPLLTPNLPLKTDTRNASPVQLLWPSIKDEDDICKVECADLDDVFIRHAHETVLCQDHLPALDPTTDISEPNSSHYDDEYFLSHGEPNSSDLLNTPLFPVSFSPETEAFFDEFTVKNGA
ncbi:Metallothionein expression activator [Ophidiomyces ophidiicola]|nr:Metallothionein expression activator [Ophidiomyces ophidiicola]KAI1997367.1 Metallothionein expression activator [Ophidiomyces ophidiicola]